MSKSCRLTNYDGQMCRISHLYLANCERLLWVTSSLSVSRKYYHLSGCFRGIPDTRHSEYPGAVAAFGQERPFLEIKC
jgi:hypothetical protein